MAPSDPAAAQRAAAGGPRKRKVRIVLEVVGVTDRPHSEWGDGLARTLLTELRESELDDFPVESVECIEQEDL